MLIDFYTKAVLTVIAISLLLIAVNPWIRETHLRVDAPGIEGAVGDISAAISFLEVGDRPSRPRKSYKKPELTEEDEAFIDRLREKR